MTMIEVCSFGYKYDQDQKLPAHYGDKKVVIYDCRKLPNPHGTALGGKDGRDHEIQDFVFKDAEANELVWNAFVEGKRAYGDGTRIVLAFGCIGGKHRSVAVAEQLLATFRGSTQVGTVNDADHFGLKAIGWL